MGDINLKPVKHIVYTYLYPQSLAKNTVIKHHLKFFNTYNRKLLLLLFGSFPVNIHLGQRHGG
jgi:hypothetical protein